MRTVPLGAITVSLESGSRPKGGVTSDGDVPSLGGEHLTDEGGLQLENVKRVSLDFFNSLRSGRIQPDDILIVKDGATTGRTCMVPPDFPLSQAAVNEHVFRLAVDRTVASPRYVFHFLRSPAGRAGIMSDFRGATVGGISRTFIDRVIVKLPPLDEQRRIAAILDYADAVRGKRRQTLSYLDDLIHGIHRAIMKSDETRTIESLRETGILIIHKDGNHGSLYPRTEDFGSEGVPFITAKALREDGTLDLNRVDYLRETKASRLKIGWIQPGDVLLSHNASVGKVTKYDGSLGPALIGTSLTCFRVNDSLMNADYLAASLRSASFIRGLERGMAQTTRNQVPITAQRRLAIPWASFDRQCEFARRAGVVADLKTRIRSALVAQDQLLAALASYAFGGRL